MVFFLFWTFVSCSSRPVLPVDPGQSPTGRPTESPSASPTSTSVEPILTEVTALPSPLPGSTPTKFPTRTSAPTPTPYVTRPPLGRAAAIPILMYHHIESLDPNASLLLKTWTVSPSNFEAQLDYLVNHNFHTVTFSQLDSFFEQNDRLPTRPVILTFDDGWIDDYNVAFPALRERGMVGTFFVPTSYAGAPGGKLVSWGQIVEMDSAGMELGGHTINHPDLKQVGKEEAVRQLQVSKANMESKLGHLTIAFAYPFGDYDATVVEQVREAGYRVAVGLCCGYNLTADKLLTLPRIRVSYDINLSDFSKMLPRESSQ